jgi:exodeoxyribonuclease V beta subunit
MTDTAEFNILESPLDGRNLIEASAGTGKTYAISRIFLRLVLEKRYDINKILTVTFTEAATEELRRRIRSIFYEAKLAFETGDAMDPLLRALLARCEKSIALERLNTALYDFDKAAIHTIHGFCRKFLHENAFECNQTFDARFITDQSELFQEIADDFWRTHFFKASPVFLSYALEKNITPKTLLDPLRRFTAHQGLMITPLTGDVDTGSLERDFLIAVRQCGEAWNACRREIEALLSPSRLDGRKYRADTCARLSADVDALIKATSPGPGLFADFGKLTCCVIAASGKKGVPPVKHAFFDLCESLEQQAAALRAAFDERLLFLQSRFIAYASDELAVRKERRNVLYFDDLLIKVSKALQSNGAGIAVRGGFQAALIDEFQDTDPVQYAIFDTLFPKGSVLFIIGDPKQAIYSFRGADIFAYLKASQRVDRRYTLSVNFRSDKNLVNAVNALFDHRPSPFVYDAITYRRVSASARHDHGFPSTTMDSHPFKFWVLTRDNHEKTVEPISIASARLKISDAVSWEISRLLSSHSTTSPATPRIHPSHIAVLVRKNKEAIIIRDALVNNGIPAIIESAGNVFDEPEAVELYRLLAALLDCANPELCKAALSTFFFGLNAGEILSAYSGGPQWERRMAELYEYHELWNNHGFIRMIRSLMVREKVRGRVLSRPGGERIVTNILHLIELLHAEASRRRLSPRCLCSWLSTKIGLAPSAVSDEEMMRLESDENAVRVMTIHKSKGLEYPIVFCPFSWTGSETPRGKKNAPLFFHDPDNGDSPTLALSPETIDANRAVAELEALAENIRLLYVSVTRAKFRCYCAWGMISSAETSAMAYLLGGDAARTQTVRELGASFKGMTDASIMAMLAPLARLSNNTVEIVPLAARNAVSAIPQWEITPALHFVRLTTPLPAPWTIASFSSLTRLRPASAEGEDDAPEEHDAENDSGPRPGVETNLHGFPRGARTGLFFHAVLEHLDFTKSDSDETELLLDRQLHEYGFSAAWREPLRRMVKDLVSLRLGPAGRFSLAMVSPNSCVREMEFHFPLRRIAPAGFDVLLTNGTSSEKAPFGRLEFSPVRGFMKGFIDCIVEHDGLFYLIDWKSNYLGSTFEDYESSSLEKVMARERYSLQYHIYLAALNEYLSIRLPNYRYEEHFGGVFYIFLRGISARGAGNGIFFRKPTESTIRLLSETLIDREHGNNRD